MIKTIGINNMQVDNIWSFSQICTQYQLTQPTVF